jgi:hypothetical protein
MLPAEMGCGLGMTCWRCRVVERTHAWFNRFRRLPVRHERRADIDEAATGLAASLITLNPIRRFCKALLLGKNTRVSRQGARRRGLRPAFAPSCIGQSLLRSAEAPQR